MSELTRQVEKLETSSKEEGDFPLCGRTGYARERKKSAWVISCKESAKRETETFKMLESAADDSKVEDGDNGDSGKP